MTERKAGVDGFSLLSPKHTHPKAERFRLAAESSRIPRFTSWSRDSEPESFGNSATHQRASTPASPESRKHFNRSLPPSATQNWRTNKNVKTKLKLTLSFTMTATDGSGKHVRYPIKIVCRADIERAHDWAAENSDERDYLIFRTPMKIGLRTEEICTFSAEYIHYETCHIRILDSKKHCLFTLPIDLGTLELLRKFLRGRTEGYVFTQKTSWKHVKANVPLTKATVWRIIHQIGLAVGIPTLKPRDLRDYFAIDFHYVKEATMKSLQTGLRHGDIASTNHYLSPMYSLDDFDREYHEKMDSRYFNPATACADCSSLKVCKYAERMPVFATGCAFKPTITPKEEL